MALFRTVSINNISYSTPQEMFYDRKNRQIDSLYDHQNSTLDNYMSQGYDQRDLSLELPTGSGKTLVGLLLGEFRRVKNRERVVYCCLNRLLVNQVCTQASEQYGIDARPFVGKKVLFDRKDVDAYHQGKCVAVTTYSALFNSNPFFEDPDVLIFDDAHSGGDIVASNWTCSVDANEENQLFEKLVDVLKPALAHEELKRLTSGERSATTGSWVGFMPLIAVPDLISRMKTTVDSWLVDNGDEHLDLKFSWGNIKENLEGCFAYFSTDNISIRPVIPPTRTFAPFARARQRIYMSATLGERGELERAFGVDAIFSLPMLNKWKGRTTGRRLFMFPLDVATRPTIEEALSEVLHGDGRAIVIVDSHSTLQRYLGIIEKTGRPVVNAHDLEHGKQAFLKSSDSVALVANRLDGIDFPGDECRQEIVLKFPRATHLQEKFLVQAVNAEAIYKERLRTRLTQMLGRCTRSETDYAVVQILDKDVVRLLKAPLEREALNEELQAEIEFGLANCEDQVSLGEYLELSESFLSDRGAWQEAEQNIVELRSEIINRELITSDDSQILKESSAVEVRAALELWNRQYELAADAIQRLLSMLETSDELSGYYSFWSYIMHYCLKLTNGVFQARYQAIDGTYLRKAKESTPFDAWIVDRTKGLLDSRGENATVLARLREKLNYEMARKSSTDIQRELVDLLQRLKDEKGHSFERAHCELGQWLGYKSFNPSGDGEPDPIWIIDANTCIVAEDKIYEKDDKVIPVNDVSQAARHAGWVRANEKIALNADAEIDTIFLTTASKYIDRNGELVAGDIWHVVHEDFVAWAERAIGALEEYVLAGNLPRQNENFNADMKSLLLIAGATSSHFLDLIRRKKLANLRTK